MTSAKEYQLVVLGGGAVGKSAMTVRFVCDHFLETYDPTIEDSYRTQLMVDDRVALFDILDTAGQSEYSAMRSQYMRYGRGFLMVYSVTSRISFDEIPPLRDQLYQSLDVDPIDYKNVPVTLCANKRDIPLEQWEVSYREGQDLAAQYGWNFIETSAKQNLNVREAFFSLVRDIRAIDYAKNNCLSKNVSSFRRYKQKLNRLQRNNYQRQKQKMYRKSGTIGLANTQTCLPENPQPGFASKKREDHRVDVKLSADHFLHLYEAPQPPMPPNYFWSTEEEVSSIPESELDWAGEGWGEPVFGFGPFADGGDATTINPAYIYRARRRVFPQFHPTICIGSLSCRRPNVLIQSLTACIHHMEHYEPNITYEVAVVDNASTNLTQQVLAQFLIERVLALKENYGQGFGLNMLFFSLCKWSDYILSIEDDWFWEESRTTIKNIIERAIEVMEAEPSVVMVLLRDSKMLLKSEVTDQLVWKTTESGYGYRILEGFYTPFAVYVNGGALLHRERIKNITMFDDFWFKLHGRDSVEKRVSVALKRAGYRGAQLLEIENTPVNMLKHIGVGSSNRTQHAWRAGCPHINVIAHEFGQDFP